MFSIRNYIFHLQSFKVVVKRVTKNTFTYLNLTKFSWICKPILIPNAFNRPESKFAATIYTLSIIIRKNFHLALFNHTLLYKLDYLQVFLDELSRVASVYHHLLSIIHQLVTCRLNPISRQRGWTKSVKIRTHLTLLQITANKVTFLRQVKSRFTIWHIIATGKANNLLNLIKRNSRVRSLLLIFTECNVAFLTS
ncbi:hypothetical protein EGR_00295 [Echinococcus granulosus]|uniref:Uncharacterized protein n=1 Tax=Echinococcus granulosus TaxID=6210 RepID=W6UWL0_ECHGR|nr:hypothetical protein EGR_00295 [Echinococcus granulosus]EUB65026.1 hypothetical protein EGR_00295 [Echinococcus granulosus]